MIRGDSQCRTTFPLRPADKDVDRIQSLLTPLPKGGIEVS